ncbi:MAG: hypothetical protein KC635_18470 [Myxococcales bacterium]|nr:hypothetical protein [Myxococcales bacterium]MCB9732959.1 hypothetical protein [Deltaproteobacteria bacterium]
MNARSSTLVALVAACLLPLAAAPGARADEGAASDGGDQARRSLTTTGTNPRPMFAIWQEPGGDGFIKPVIELGSLVVGYFPSSDQAEGLASRVSTLALARFGMEGRLFGLITFRSVFERNLGFSLARNGPVGTSVWEGTGSFSARENYLRFDVGDFSITGGIIRDPASVDFVSVNILDAFGMDPYVRDPLLVSGFNQSQGLLLNYQAGPVTFGLAFTGGNPLTTSLAFGFGGDVTSLGTLFTAPLRALSNGVPGSDIQVMTFSPSVILATDVVDVAVAGQFYAIDVDATTDSDESINGFNARMTARLKLLDRRFQFYLSGAYRKNQQLAVPDLTTRTDAYEGVVFGTGFDLSFDRVGAGAQYYYLHSELNSQSNLTNHYLNVGLTYWLEPPYASVGLRWARTMAESEPTKPRLQSTDSIILSMRLML